MPYEIVVKKNDINRLWNKLLWASAILIIALLSVFPVQSEEKIKEVGFVLGSRGNWLLEIKDQAPESISLGRSLPAGARIRAQNPQPADYIEIVLMNNRTVKLSCDEQTACAQPLILPESLEKQSSILTRIGDAVRQVLSLRNRENMVLPLARGIEHLQDAVIKIEDGQCDLSPVFSNMDAGLYYLSFRKIYKQDNINDQDSINPIDFKWDPNSSGKIKANYLKPGLYHLTLMRKYGGHFAPHGDEALVLFVRPEDYERTNAYFEEAVKLTNEWGADIRVDSVRNFLLIYLESLDDENRSERD